MLEIKVCILMAKFQGTTVFVMFYEGSSSTTWIWWTRENLRQLLGGDSTCDQITISSNGKRLKDSKWHISLFWGTLLAVIIINNCPATQKVGCMQILKCELLNGEVACEWNIARGFMLVNFMMMKQWQSNICITS